jgi:hypothetical protein
MFGDDARYTNTFLYSNTLPYGALTLRDTAMNRGGLAIKPRRNGPYSIEAERYGDSSQVADLSDHTVHEHGTCMLAHAQMGLDFDAHEPVYEHTGRKAVTKSFYDNVRGALFTN